MTGEAHGLTRFPGKPYSGRLVYKGRESGTWWWQCDICWQPEYAPDAPGFQRWRDAVSDALRHAPDCPGTQPSEPDQGA